MLSCEALYDTAPRALSTGPHVQPTSQRRIAQSTSNEAAATEKPSSPGPLGDNYIHVGILTPLDPKSRILPISLRIAKGDSSKTLVVGSAADCDIQILDQNIGKPYLFSCLIPKLKLDPTLRETSLPHRLGKQRRSGVRSWYRSVCDKNSRNPRGGL